MKKNLTLILNGCFEQEHYGKDVFLFPYYLGKRYGMDVHIVYLQSPTNKSFPAEYRNAKFHPLESASPDRFDFASYRPYIEEHAKEIDFLMLFHATHTTEKTCILYKTLNKAGFCYVKLDAGVGAIPARTKLKRNVVKLLWNVARSHIFCRMVDYVSVETTPAFDLITKSKAVNLAFGNKLHYHSNGFDEELFDELGMKVRSVSQKENLIITVGRLGTYPKNTLMLLNSLKHVNLGDWKVLLIGPVAPEFEEEIRNFYREYPDKQEQVEFVGSITDLRTLWEYYNRAKVFCLTSDWESFALVLTEAYRFGDYIVTTPVGAYRDVVLANNVGECVPVNDYKALASSLQNIVDGKTDIDVYTDGQMLRKFSMERIVEEFEL